MGVGLVLNLIQVFVEYHKTGEYMDRDINALMEISHSPASQIAYNIDTRLAGELLNGMVRHPAVIDARIIDPDGHTLAAATSNRVDSSHRWINDLLFGDFRRYETGLRVPDLKEMDLGYLVVTISPNHYGNLFLSRAGFILLSGIFKTLVLTAMLLVTFYWLVTKPILSVISSLQHVGSASEKARLQTPNSHEEDEIGTLVDIINRHLETVDASIRQMRALKDEMKDYSSKLEREVEERTQEITEKNAALKRSNRALVRAKEEAVHRAQIRARFLASMSHEVRTPLNGVLGMLELVLESDLAPAQRQQLEIALRAGETLLSLLNDILDISKVEAGKLDLEVISFDL